MITLKEAKELTNDKLTQEVIDEFRKSPILDMLEFDDTVTPNGETMTYSYNVITTQPKAGTRAINGEYEAQETKTTRKSTDLKIMGGSYKLDRALVKGEKQVVDQVDFQSKQKAKATVAEFNDLFINGDSATKAEEFDGLKVIVAGKSTEYIPTEAIDLSDADKIKANYNKFLLQLRKLNGKMGQKPTHYLMNSDMYAVFQAIADIVPNVKYVKDEMGNDILKYGPTMLVELGDKPGTEENIIKTSEETGETEIYAVCLGRENVHGISLSGSPLLEQHLPDFTTAGAVKEGDVELIAAIVAKTTKSVGKIAKIKIQ